jgi:3-ketoacyl-CoA synthase
MEKARLEFDLVVMTSIEEVLKKTGVKPKEIGVVVVNCSLFTPTPSLSAVIMNRFKMGNNVINYNLGGMGCSGEAGAKLERKVLLLL